jgi:DNA-binding transcriptional MerR regulator/methylmalonyl-CoA mutase cobalamin-binding subunit
MNEQEPLYPINFVSKQSGLSTHTIRMWERRYGAVNPQRTDTKHRKYSDADISRLRLLHRATEDGHSIGKIAKLPDETLRNLLRNAYNAPVQSAEEKLSRSSGEANAYLEKCQQAVAEMNRDTLEQTLMRASVELSYPELLEGLVSPLLFWVGQEWHGGTLRVAHEHLASACIRAFLERMRRTITRDGAAHRISVTTLAGQKHEMGALMVSIVAAMEGWQDFYFGPDMPASEIAKGVIQTQSKVVAISAPLLGNEGQLYQELMDLRELLPQGVHVIAGGAGVASIQTQLKRIGVDFAPSLDAFREILGALKA